MLKKTTISKKLKEVIDPELGVSVVDLGLIYGIEVEGNSVFVLMTLTFPGCPLASVIQKEVENKLKEVEGIGGVEVKLTFDPPWDSSKITRSARAKLGII